MTETKDCDNVWISEPRWSWYGTPLWKCWAVEIRFFKITVDNSLSAQVGGGSLNLDNLKTSTERHRAYFTPEEYVYFKLDDIFNTDQNKIVNELRKRGIIYS